MQQVFKAAKSSCYDQSKNSTAATHRDGEYICIICRGLSDPGGVHHQHSTGVGDGVSKAIQTYIRDIRRHEYEQLEVLS